MSESCSAAKRHYKGIAKNLLNLAHVQNSAEYLVTLLMRLSLSVFVNDKLKLDEPSNINVFKRSTAFTCESAVESLLSTATYPILLFAYFLDQLSVIVLDLVEQSGFQIYTDEPHFMGSFEKSHRCIAT